MKTQAIEFNFAAKRDRKISQDNVLSALQVGHHCWLDVELAEGESAEDLLREFGIKARVIRAVLSHDSVGRHDVHEECLHVALAVPTLTEGRVEFQSIDLLLGERFIITLHHNAASLLDQVRERYPTFFRKFAQSLGFLLFEIWDSLIERHRKVLAGIESQVEQTQGTIFSVADDSIFEHVSELTEDLLNLRKNVLALREALDQLATHKSAFVAESTQPYLSNMVGTLDRLANDLTVEREILAETLNLYLGIVSHRTNRLLHRLTLVSVIFMPLMFLCGIYGMNFDSMPELHWPHGYTFFWILAITVVSCMVVMTRVRRMW